MFKFHWGECTLNKQTMDRLLQINKNLAEENIKLEKKFRNITQYSEYLSKKIEELREQIPHKIRLKKNIFDPHAEEGDNPKPIKKLTVEPGSPLAKLLASNKKKGKK